MKKYNVLHISPTPLVDAPRKVSEELNKSPKFTSTTIIFNDYPGTLAGVFSQQSILYTKNKDLAIKLIEEADIIHIHNFLSEEQEQVIFQNSKSDIKFIYQVHSPLREGPNFVEYQPKYIEFDKKCVIAQYHTRLYPDYEMVPNIILHEPSLNPIQKTEKPKVLFSPAHKRTGGRWNDKYSNELMEALESLSKLKKIELIIAEGYTPHELYILRTKCHITIDEITTGAFHQISLEGLCAGNVVINNSDCFSNDIFKHFVNANDDLPFYKVNRFNVYDRLFTLVSNHEQIAGLQQKSYEFFECYLKPRKLIKSFEKIYLEVLDDVSK